MLINKEFEHESMQDNASVVQFLKALIEGFEKGKISLKAGPDQMALVPNDLIKFNLKAKLKREKVKLSLRMSWKAEEEDQPNQEEFVIDSK